MHSGLRYFLSCLLALYGLTTFGCGKAASPGGSEEAHHHVASASGGHSHIGPHKGHLIELGANEEYHAELVRDEANHLVTIYILDGSAKKNVPISLPELLINIVSAGTPRQYKLVAVPQEGEAAGTASCFQLADEELCTVLGSKDSKGRISVSIENKQFVGEIVHHDDEDHRGGAHSETEK